MRKEKSTKPPSYWETTTADTKALLGAHRIHRSRNRIGYLTVSAVVIQQEHKMDSRIRLWDNTGDGIGKFSVAIGNRFEMGHVRTNIRFNTFRRYSSANSYVSGN